MRIPWPYTNAPGEEAQEGAGKLINTFVERRGDAEAVIWRRAPGVRVFITDPSMGSMDGSAGFVAISNVKNSNSTMAGNSTMSAAGVSGVNRSGIGELNSSAGFTAVSTYST